MHDHVNRLLESLPRCKWVILKPKYYLPQDNSASAHASWEFDEKRCSDSKFCTFFYYLGQNEFSQKVLTSFYSKGVFKNDPLRTSLVGSGQKCTCQCWGHRFHPWSGKIPHATGQLSPWATTIEPVLWGLGAATTERMLHNYNRLPAKSLRS